MATHRRVTGWDVELGRYKWEKLGLRYALRETPPPSPHLVAHVAARFRERGLNVV